ncbi:unnamed protein product [Ceutorhynchus assimilis]|uniref:NADH dehydrogenase [ubiquinone] 1 subunit C2 n=1 Tax=Ceutorhynchus assimilis TaxID=467358 RepID=A0A9N9MHP7_9CUCU|nr:unnamed protein product [Ceutorhynchus assimilis]
MERPKIAESPLELLDTPGIEPGLINQYFGPVAFGTLGLTTSVLAHWVTKRPIWSGLQIHVASTALGAYIGHYMEKRRNAKMAVRDAIFRDYIRLHPDEFPPYERKQYKDIFEKWIPIR